MKQRLWTLIANWAIGVLCLVVTTALVWRSERRWADALERRAAAKDVAGHTALRSGTDAGERDASVAAALVQVSSRQGADHPAKPAASPAGDAPRPCAAPDAAVPQPNAQALKHLFATVRITEPGTGQEGSGVLLGYRSGDAYLLTAYHIVGPAPQVAVAVYTPETYPAPARDYQDAWVVAADHRSDLALVRVSMPSAVCLPLAGELPPRERERFVAHAVGCVAGKAPTAIEVRVVGHRPIRRETGEKSVQAWEIDARMLPGMSGGPLVDEAGQVIGVASGVSRLRTYYSDLTEIRGFLQRHGCDWLLGTPAEEHRL